ncbi:DNA gyrase subunit B, novobiocin-resistant [Streptomyces sp. enrichment culture]|uniref:DNA gyrase subunit B n=1 Tax=Streptomyces sp. enrichment culture TaxID=1795815 RepID=UPI003F56297D
MSEESTGYDASRIQVIEGPEAVRRRPGMYIGSTTERGLSHMVCEVADRAVNEVLDGRGTRVEITLSSDGAVRVADDGPGVPLDEAGDAAGPGLEALLTRMPCRPAAVGRHHVMLAPFRVGPAAVNALSRRMTAEVRRQGVRWVQEYARGLATTPLTEAGTATGSGTTLTFWPDADVFGTAEVPFDALEERFRELALLNRGLAVTLTDLRRADEPRTVRLRFPDGARDFVAHLDGHAAAPAPTDPIAFTYEDPRMAGTMELAFRWSGCPGERMRSFANSRPTIDGTHVQGFRDGVAAAVTAYARGQGMRTASDAGIDADRIGHGLTAVVSVKLDRPEFRGPTHAVLANADVRDCVAEAVRDHLGRWLKRDAARGASVTRAALSGERGREGLVRPLVEEDEAGFLHR